MKYMMRWANIHRGRHIANNDIKRTITQQAWIRQYFYKALYS